MYFTCSLDEFDKHTSYNDVERTKIDVSRVICSIARDQSMSQFKHIMAGVGAEHGWILVHIVGYGWINGD